MNKDEYNKLVKKLTPKEKKGKNAIVAFLTGGFIGFLAEAIAMILMECFGISRVESYQWTCLIVIFIACLFTAIGFFDNWVTKAKMGIILPTTGFAHSIMSAGLDYKKDGLITGIGANFFKLAGSVILYGMVSAFFFAILGVILYG